MLAWLSNKHRAVILNHALSVVEVVVKNLQPNRQDSSLANLRFALTVTDFSFIFDRPQVSTLLYINVREVTLFICPEKVIRAAQ